MTIIYIQNPDLPDFPIGVAIGHHVICSCGVQYVDETGAPVSPFASARSVVPWPTEACPSVVERVRERSASLLALSLSQARPESNVPEENEK